MATFTPIKIDPATDRLVADAEPGRDGLVRQAVRQMRQHLELARRQRIGNNIIVISCSRDHEVRVGAAQSPRLGHRRDFPHDLHLVGKRSAQGGAARRGADEDYSHVIKDAARGFGGSGGVGRVVG